MVLTVTLMPPSVLKYRGSCLGTLSYSRTLSNSYSIPGIRPTGAAALARNYVGKENSCLVSARRHCEKRGEAAECRRPLPDQPPPLTRNESKNQKQSGSDLKNNFCGTLITGTRQS